VSHTAEEVTSKTAHCFTLKKSVLGGARSKAWEIKAWSAVTAAVTADRNAD
jgi:hypothetical protein